MNEQRKLSTAELHYFELQSGFSADLIDEVSENLGAFLDIDGQGEDVIALYQFLIRTGGKFLSILRPRDLQRVREVIARWFKELDDPDEEKRFAKVYELLDYAAELATERP